jgi:hypothetical protein
VFVGRVSGCVISSAMPPKEGRLRARELAAAEAAAAGMYHLHTYIHTYPYYTLTSFECYDWVGWCCHCELTEPNERWLPALSRSPLWSDVRVGDYLLAATKDHDRVILVKRYSRTRVGKFGNAKVHFEGTCLVTGTTISMYVILSFLSLSSVCISRSHMKRMDAGELIRATGRLTTFILPVQRYQVATPTTTLHMHMNDQS